MKKFAIIDSNSGDRYAFLRDEAVCGSDGYTAVDLITFWHLVYDDESKQLINNWKLYTTRR